MSEIDVYIGKVEDVPLSDEVLPDDDELLENTPKEVVQILGFDPKELED